MRYSSIFRRSLQRMRSARGPSEGLRWQLLRDKAQRVGWQIAYVFDRGIGWRGSLSLAQILVLVWRGSLSANFGGHLFDHRANVRLLCHRLSLCKKKFGRCAAFVEEAVRGLRFDRAVAVPSRSQHE